MKPARLLSLIVLSGLVLLSGRGTALAGPPYRTMTVTHGGKISGTVRLEGEAPAVPSLGISKDAKVCGGPKQSPRLRLGKNNGVAQTVISLEGMAAGKQHPPAKTPVVEQVHCEYVPHILVVPSGSAVDIVNGDPILHNVHAYQGDPGTASVFNIAQPIRGHHTTIRADQLSAAGVSRLICDAGHPWMSAYIIVAEHPYYAVTDKDGNFALENVPPGTYKLRLWHEGVRNLAPSKPGAPATYTYEAPYEETKEVTVPPDEDVSVEFSLSLR